MNLSKNDYRKLYQIQDSFFKWLSGFNFPFYLTGGTALGRFYLQHRYSDDLDFFVNSDPRYPEYIAELKSNISKSFNIDIKDALFTDDFTRLFIEEGTCRLKIEFVNDIEYCAANPVSYSYGIIDTPLNILANKITAVVDRDEPKDIFDIVYLSLNYSFNWPDVFYHAKRKAVINEIDVEKRLISFPVEMLEPVNWLKSPVEPILFQKQLENVANDFFLGKKNSLGKNKTAIEDAKPLRNKKST